MVALSKRGATFSLKILKILLLAFGLGLLAFMIHRIGLANIADELQKLGLNIGIILIPYFLVYLFDALGWRLTLGERGGSIGFGRIFMCRMAGEAVNYITPSAYLAGEPVKAYLIRRHGVALLDGLASVVTAKTVMVIAQVLFILLGIGLALLSQPDDDGILIASGLILAIVSLSAAFLVFVQHRGMFSGLLRLLEILSLPTGFLKRREESIRELDERIRSFYRERRGSLGLTLGLFMLGWLIGSLEVYLVIYYLGLPIDLFTAISIEALATVIRAAVFFIPSGLGAQEGGNILLFAAFGFSPVTAMTFSILRRVREALWIGIGLLYMAKAEVGVLKYREDG